MEKILSKKKIIILSFVIVFTILIFSIAIFGLISYVKKDKNGEGAVTASGNFVFTYGGVTTTMYYEYDPVLGRGDEGFCKVYDNSSKSTLEFYHYYKGGNYGRSTYIYTYNGLRVLGYVCNGGTMPNGYSPNDGNTTVTIENSITITSSGWEPYTKWYAMMLNAEKITNNSGMVVTVDLVINTVDDLKNFSTNVNSGRTYLGVSLVADIVFSSSDTFTSIGTFFRPFTGTFYGNGHYISNIPVASCEYEEYDGDGDLIYDSRFYGLFGCIAGADICDLQITNTNWNITQDGTQAKPHIGLLVGGVKPSSGTSNITNCLVSNSSITFNEVSVSSKKVVIGGFVGIVDYASTLNINKTGVDCDITINGGLFGLRKGAALGGIVGNVWNGANLNVTSSYYYGTIQVKPNAQSEDGYRGVMCIGGIVGLFGIIHDEYNLYDISGSGSVSMKNCFVHFVQLTVQMHTNPRGEDIHEGSLSAFSEKGTGSGNLYYIQTQNLSGVFWISTSVAMNVNGGSLSTKGLK